MRLPGLTLGQRGQVVLAIAGAAAGTVLGAVVQNQLNSPINVAYATLGVVCLLVVGLATTLIGTIDTSKQSQDAVLSRLDTTSAQVREVLASSTRQVESTLAGSMHDIEDVVRTASGDTRAFLLDLGRQVSLRVRSQSVEQTNGYRRPDDDIVVRAFRSARSEILALDRLTATGVRPDVGIDPEKMRWHLDAIEERVRSGVRYQRAIQVDDPNLRRPFQALRRSLEVEGREDVFAQHCVRAAGWTATRPDVVLKVTRYFFPYKFLVIDSTTLVLQLHSSERRAGSVEPRTLCELVIEDPQAAFIGQFVTMWRAVDADVSTRAVSLLDKDLAALAGIADRDTSA